MTDNEAINLEGIILDTHTLIWYTEGIKLSKLQVDLIAKAREQNILYISAISIWEIALLANKGKIALSVSLPEWVISYCPYLA